MTTVTLTLDGREVQVPPGSTILEAAEALGIEIPTLCHLREVEAVGSCFLCVVEVEGRSNLVPACASKVQEGMVVRTQTDAVGEARRTALELLLSDHTGDCVAPCTHACPAGLDIPGFVERIRRDDLRGAVAIVRESIPLAGVLGRICPGYCERACRRRDMDESVAIRALKRVVADADLAREDVWVPRRHEPTGKRIAVVGAGPAGLTAAYHLQWWGHDCTVFDQEPAPGGLLRYAVPDYRLPREILEADIAVIQRLGTRFEMGKRLGTDFDLGSLQRDFDAILLAMGASSREAWHIEGGELAGGAASFLRQVNEGEHPRLGDSLLVVGAGHEAVAASRAALRLQVREVKLVWEKERRDMPCPSEIVDEAEAEGVQILTCVQAMSLSKTRDVRIEVACREGAHEVRDVADAVLAGPERSVDADMVKRLGFNLGKRGILADRETLQVGSGNVFAAGEIVSGPSSCVRALAAGRGAARSIHQVLSGVPARGEAKPYHSVMGKLGEEELARLFRGASCVARCAEPRLDPLIARTSFQEIVSGVPGEEAQQEAARCLQCDCLAKDGCLLREYATRYDAKPRRFKGERRAWDRDASHPVVIYEPGKCILCGICVRLASKMGIRPGIAFLGRGFRTCVAVPFAGTVAEGLGEAAEACAAACPTGALALKPNRKISVQE